MTPFLAAIRKVLISLPQHEERKLKTLAAVRDFGWGEVECVAPKPVNDIPLELRTRYDRRSVCLLSQVITLAEVFARALAGGGEAVLLLEDDVVFHPEFLGHLDLIEIPEDWRFCYLGGAICGTAFKVNERLLRADWIVDLHAVVIRKQAFERLAPKFQEAAENHRGKRNVTPADLIIAEFHKTMPAYICRPNLVWQSEHYSDLQHRVYTNYRPDGSHKFERYQLVS